MKQGSSTASPLGSAGGHDTIDAAVEEPKHGTSKVALVWDPRMLLHLAHTVPDNIWDDDHQKEQPGRLAGIVQRLGTGMLLNHPCVTQTRICVPATHEQLRAVHTDKYLARVAALDTRDEKDKAELDLELAKALMNDQPALTETGNSAPGYNYVAGRSVYSCDYTPSVASLAAGGVIQAVDAVVAGGAQSAFAIVRPPGHHCSSCAENGFCWLNNVAIAAKHAQRAHGSRVKRVAILDWDIHAGDGTQEIVSRDPSLLLISLHRYMPQTGFGFYPGTGASNDWGLGPGVREATVCDEDPGGEGSGVTNGGSGSPSEPGPRTPQLRRACGNVVNIPLPHFALGDHEYASVLEMLVLPLLREWGADLLMVSCGFDAAHGDPLGGMHVTPEGYRHMSALVTAAAPPCGIVFALEGGYNVESISASCEGVVRALVDAAAATPSTSGSPVPPVAQVPLLPPSAPLPPYLHPAVLQTMRNVASAQSEFFACMRELDASPQRLLPRAPEAASSSSSSSIIKHPALLVDHAFDHQKLRKACDFGRKVVTCPSGRGFRAVSYARPRFPRKAFEYSASPYCEPVQDTHLYLLLAPACDELRPPATNTRQSSVAGADAVSTGGGTAASPAGAAPEVDADDGLGGLTSSLGKLTMRARGGEGGPAPDATPAPNLPPPSPPKSVHAASSPAKPPSEGPATRRRTRLSAIGAEPAGAAAVTGKPPAVVSGGPAATPQPAASLASPAEASVPPPPVPGAFWKPFGPAQVWVQNERWFPTHEAAFHATADEKHGKKPTGASGRRSSAAASLASVPGGRDSIGSAASGSSSTDAEPAPSHDAAAEVPATFTTESAGPETPYLVVADMLGRILLKLQLQPAHAKPRAVTTAPPASASGLRGWQATLRGSSLDPDCVGLFPHQDASEPPAAAAGGGDREWHLLDGLAEDDGAESRVLVAPGCAGAYAGAACDAALPPNGFVPVTPQGRTAATRDAIRGAAPGQPFELPQQFRVGDYRVLAMRVYLGDERDDDKVEKEQWSGREPAVAFTDLLRRFAVAAAAAASPGTSAAGAAAPSS